MHTTNLRKVGGSIMLAVPPAILDLLLAQCDASAEVSAEDRTWLDSKPVGSELL
jgi:antitoxin ChpS